MIRITRVNDGKSLARVQTVWGLLRLKVRSGLVRGGLVCGWLVCGLVACGLVACWTHTPARLAEFEGGAQYEDHGLKVVCLYGTWEQMGRQWGALEKEPLRNVLSFIEGKTKSDACAQSFQRTAERVYSHYPQELKAFMTAATETSGLGLDELIAVNAVEWGEGSFRCSGMACWGDYTGGPLVYGRNYDAASYRELRREVTLTVYHPDGGGQAFATLGYAGEVYCVNGFNESGLFVELNNGMPSSGSEVNFDISLSTTELMRLIAEARSMDDVDAFLTRTPSAAGFLIGVSDGQTARCYEWRGDDCHRSDMLTPEGLVVMTNHFNSPEWDLPDPAEENCWQSHARYHNLTAFAQAHKGRMCAELVEEVLRRPIAEGGAKLNDWDMYQFVYLPSEQCFLIHIPGTDIRWEEIRLRRYWGT